MTNALPPGWASVPLSSIGTWLGGGTPSKSVKEYWASGTVPWVSPKDMKRLLIDSAQDQITEKAVKESATNLIPVSSVLMVTRSGILEHTFPVAVNTVPVTINQDLKAWTPAHGIDPLYVAYFLRSRGQLILDTCSKDGTTVSSIDFDRLSRFEVSLAPSQAQTRIVSKIDELFSEIEEGERALERVQKLVERYRQSVLKAAVTGELTRDWRAKQKGKIESGEALLRRILKARREAWERAESATMRIKGMKPVNDNWKQRYREPVPPDASELPQLPEGWVWASIDQLAMDVTYGTSAKCNDDQSGVPVIRMGNINGGEIDTSDLKYLPLRHTEFPALFLREGDMLFNRTNSAELVGKSAIFKSTEGHWSFASYLIRVRFAVINADWIAHYINSVFGRAWISTVRNQQVGQANVNGSKLKALPIPLPPLLEMNESLDRVNQHIGSATAAIQTNAEHVRLARALRQSILKCAFEGQLSARDPSDEPAAALLERIGAERSQSMVAKKPSPRKRHTA